MAHTFQQRLFRQFVLISVLLGLPLLGCIVVLGTQVPRAHIASVSLATAANIAEAMSTNLALNRITLNPAFSVEGHVRQTQSVFYPIASKAREALLRRTDSDFIRELLTEYIATDIQLLLSPSDQQSRGQIVAALNKEQIGEWLEYAGYQDNDVSAKMDVLEFGYFKLDGTRQWSALAPVFDRDNNTVALVAVHSQSGTIIRMNLLSAFFLVLLIAGMITLSVYFASRTSKRIQNPIKTLHNGMLALSEGNLDVSLSPHHTGDELDDLIRHFNRTSHQLREHMAMLQSMEMAAEIQSKLLPAEMPEIRHYDLSAALRYAELAGGDYYDLIPLSSADSQTDKWLLVIADVTGHGISAALLVAWLRASVRTLARECQDDLPLLFSKLNSNLFRDMQTGKFVTLFCMIVTPGQPTVSWLSAGHDPVHVFRSENDKIELLEAMGPPIGVVPQDLWERAQTLDLHKSDLMLLATDGLQDTQNAKGHRLGIEAVRTCARGNKQRSCAAISEALLDLVDRHRGQTKLADDVTLMLVKYMG